MEKVLEILEDLGYLRIPYSVQEELVCFPGGSYRNDVYRVQLHQGPLVNFSKTLVDRYPEVCAAEIQNIYSRIH